MLFRFSLYGFLKNQQYYEPFLVLAFLEKGLSFTMIGVLIGFREICINLLEAPTGAVADVTGRRRAMICSFAAYIAAFVIFGLAGQVWMLFAAMFFFSIGEAFRTGTHKAMIFDWLARQGRENEKTRIYGLTRSWSKMGSAVSVVIAAGLVFATQSYSWIFFACIGPYLANIVNFLGYPSYLDGPPDRPASLGNVLRTLGRALRESVHSRPLRRLLTESMAFEGVYKAGKDYLQPVLKAAALALPFFLGMDDLRRTALLVGPVYCVLFLLGSFASRHADALRRRAGSEDRAARGIWAMNLAAFAVLIAGIMLGWAAPVVAAFVALAILQNFWRPILVSRVAEHTEPDRAATILSIESQAKSLAAAVLAPLLGFLVDQMPKDHKFLPVGVLGFLVAAIALTASRRSRGPIGPDRTTQDSSSTSSSA